MLWLKRETEPQHITQSFCFFADAKIPLNHFKTIVQSPLPSRFSFPPTTTTIDLFNIASLSVVSPPKKGSHIFEQLYLFV